MLSDDTFLAQFESLELPFDQWTHRAHVKVAYLYLRDHCFADALELTRAGVKAYNAHNKVAESPTSGYNETTTRALLHLIASTMRSYGLTHPVASADAFCDMHPQLMSKHILRLFYSPNRRMHPDAKSTFVPPDLTALPRLPNGEDDTSA